MIEKNVKGLVYIAGDMLTQGAQMLRAKEREEIESLGCPLYNPADQKDINDKQNVETHDNLAERIVAKDSAAIRSSEHLAYDLSGTCVGTTVEVGQSLGMQQLAQELQEVLNQDKDDSELVKDFQTVVAEILSKKHYPHMEDIRHFDISEHGQRRSFSINAYLLGATLQLTSGKGFYEWAEVLESLEKGMEGEK